MYKRFNLGLFPRRQGGNHKLVDVTIILGSTKGAGSSTRIFNYCKQTSPQPWNCIDQFINVSQPTPPPTPPPPTPTPTVLVYNTSQGSIFVWDGVTFTYDNTLPNYSYTAITTSIPASTVPFSNTLIEVTIGNTVTSIGNSAFLNSGLTSLTIPNSVTSIGPQAFENNEFTTVTFTPTSTLTTIGSYAFYNCTSLSSITIGNSVASIGDAAFYNCTVLESIIIPNSVEYISVEAFSYSGLTTVTISSATATFLGKTSPTPNPPGVDFFGKIVATVTP
jgi:hypothetical protein